MKINFEKGNGLVPAIIQQVNTGQVLMVGYMNEEALEKTKAEKKVTFFGRTKNRLWTKGETSGNFLKVVNWTVDCDRDSILIQVLPIGPTCHTGSYSCFGKKADQGFLYELEETIKDRIENGPETSYTNELHKKGINKIAQKVGEEAVELIIEAKDNNDELFKNEAADLMYHFILLLKAKGMCLGDIEKVLHNRNK